jgi:hypothetical protein
MYHKSIKPKFEKVSPWHFCIRNQESPNLRRPAAGAQCGGREEASPRRGGAVRRRGGRRSVVDVVGRGGGRRPVRWGGEEVGVWHDRMQMRPSKMWMKGQMGNHVRFSKKRAAGHLLKHNVGGDFSAMAFPRREEINDPFDGFIFPFPLIM